MMDWLTENAWRVPELAVTFLLLSAVVAAWAWAAKCLAERRWLLVRRVSDQETLEQSRHWRDKSDRDDEKYETQYDRIDEALPRIEAAIEELQKAHNAGFAMNSISAETLGKIKSVVTEVLSERKPPRGAGGRFTKGGEKDAER
jgi:hypothetical protein